MPTHYLLLSLKVLGRRPFFTFISIVGISLTLLVLMVIAAVFDHQLAPMPPESRQARTLIASTAGLFTADGNGQWCCSAGFALFDRYARNLPGAEHLSIHSSGSPVDSYLNGRKITSTMKRTDSEFWTIFDFSFLEGRPFTAGEVANAALVAVINAATRERFFAGASAVGSTLEANGQRFRIVGVVENVPALREPPFADIWTPYTTIKGTSYRSALMGTSGGFSAIVMASSPAALRAIRDEFNARMKRLNIADYPEFRDGTFTRIVAPFETRLDAYARGFDPPADSRSAEPQGWRVMLFFSGLALLFVMLPTLNLVNINMSRIMERASEIGVRKAFGASSRTLVGQFVVENVILTIAGGLVGVVLSAVVLRAINAGGLIPYSQLGINWRVFGYGLLLAIVFGMISGVYPAWRMSRLHPAEALRGAGR